MAMTETTTKPAYLGLLNAISLAESEAGVYLEAWANATDDEELASCLRFVAARETSHGELFCRRLDELGYSLRQKPDPKSAARLARYANPKISDCEKVGPEREEGGDAFADIKKAIADGVYDDMTCNMLQWYINEEYDSGRRLNKVYAKVREKAGMTSKKKANGANGHAAEMEAGPSADAQAIMACMTAGFAKLEKSLEKMAKAK
jgi:Mn-containing catalase